MERAARRLREVDGVLHRASRYDDGRHLPCGGLVHASGTGSFPLHGLGRELDAHGYLVGPYGLEIP